MKKLLALLLVLAMLICMVACGAAQTKDDDSEEEKVTDTESEAAQDSDELTSDTEMVSEEESESETEMESETEEDTEEATDEDISIGGGILSGILGEHDGNVYENEFLGIGCEFDSSWSVYNEEQIAELLGVASDRISDEYISELIESSNVAYLFVASSSVGSNVNILLENTTSYGLDLTEESYIEIALPMLKSGLESIGYENIQLAKATVEFAGMERQAVLIESELYGVKIYQVQIPLVYETCVAVVTVTTTGENNCEEVLNAFYALPM